MPWIGCPISVFGDLTQAERKFSFFSNLPKEGFSEFCLIRFPKVHLPVLERVVRFAIIWRCIIVKKSINVIKPPALIGFKILPG